MPLNDVLSKPIIPVTQDVPKAIKRLIQEPILIFVVSGVSNWGTHCNHLIIWKVSLTNDIFAASLLENALVGSSLRGAEAKRGVFENKRVVACFGVDQIFKVA